MPSTVVVYKCLLISPSDVGAERTSLVDAVQRWNAHIGDTLGVRVDLVRWETHSTPDLGGRAQGILNAQIVDDCDLGLAVFGSKLGTPTGGHPSGSAEEIRWLATRGSRVMVYFRTGVESVDADAEGEAGRLRAFQRELEQQGLVCGYADASNLAQLVTAHMTSAIRDLMRAEALPIAAPVQHAIQSTQASKPGRYQPVFDSELWPEEGIPKFQALRSDLRLHNRPSRLSRHKGNLRVDDGSYVPFDGFRYRTLTPGRVLVKQPSQLGGRSFGPTAYLSKEAYYNGPTTRWRANFVAGDEIEYLQYRAEGSGLIRWDGNCIALDYCPWLGDDESFQLIADPDVEQWLQVSQDDRTLGWLLVSADELEECGRMF